MANEGTLVLKYEDPIDFIVADGTGITKGAILKLTSPRTAIITSGDEDMVAGIAARDKVASDGRTRLAVFRRGVFRLMASGAISAGDAVAVKAVNLIKKADASCVGSKVLGIALQDNADVTGEIEVELNIGANNNAYA